VGGVDMSEDMSIYRYKNTTETVMRIIIIHKLTGRRFIYELSVPLFILDGITCMDIFNNNIEQIEYSIYLYFKSQIDTIITKESL
jgi:hypothetical protein